MRKLQRKSGHSDVRKGRKRGAVRRALALFMTVCLLIACAQTAFAVEISGADEEASGSEIQVMIPEEETVPEEAGEQEVIEEATDEGEAAPAAAEPAEVEPAEEIVEETVPEEAGEEEIIGEEAGPEEDEIGIIVSEETEPAGIVPAEGSAPEAGTSVPEDEEILPENDSTENDSIENEISADEGIFPDEGILLEEAQPEVVSEEKAYGDISNPTEITTGGETIESAANIELDKEYAVGYRNGEPTFLQFTAPETGYYSFNAWGSNIGNEAGLFSFHYPESWYSQNPQAREYRFFMLEGSTYYLEGSTYNPEVPFEDPDTHDYIYPSGRTVFKLSKEESFSGFVYGCASWDVGTSSSTKITFPAVTAYHDFRPVKITVAQDGNYRFTAKFDTSVVTGQTWPILLDEKGTVIAGPDDKAEETGEVGADLTAGKAYYLISHQLYETGETVVDFTGEINDPQNSYYCTDGHGHVYDYLLNKASFTGSGSYAEKCPKCGKNGESSEIPMAEAWLSDTTFQYTGSAIEPEVTVSAGGTTLNTGYYTVQYLDNVEPGTASAVVTLTDDWYEGTKTLYFYINSTGEGGYRTDLTTVSLSNIALPLAEQTCGDWQTDGIDVPGGAHYSVEDFCWIREDHWSGLSDPDVDALAAADKFEAGKTYVARMIVTAEEGYRFAKDAQDGVRASVFINGYGEQTLTDFQKEVAGSYENGDVRSIVVACSFVCEDPGNDPGPGGNESDEEKIDQVGLTLAVPKPGTDSSSSENLNFASVPAGSKYSVEWTGWYGPGPDFAEGVGSFTFEAGQTCRASITLKADDGYDFSDPLTVNVSGGTLVEVTEVYNAPGGGYSGVNMVVEVRIETVKSNQTITASNVSKTFGNAAFTLAASTSGDGALSFASDNTKVAAVNSTTGLVTIKGAGKAIITIKAAATNKYNAASKKVTVTVAPAKLAAGNVTVASGTFTYNGKAKTPAVTVKSGSATLKKDTDYTLTYGSNTNAGTAKVTVSGKGNYTGTVAKTFTIAKAAQTITAKAAASPIAVGKTTTVSITGAKGTKSYTSSNTAVATVTSAGKVTAKKVGTVKIKAASAATANYKAASKEVTIKVVPAATGRLTASNQAKGIQLTWTKVAGANGYIVYRNNAKARTITSGATIAWTDTAANTNGTKYVYKVVAKASTGTSPLSKSVTVYRIDRPAIKTLKNDASKKMTVTWAKNAKSTGYQIQYALNNKFNSGLKTVTITSASTVSKAIGSLTKGKTYYVRIRTVKKAGTVTCYSAWSAAKALKITK